MPARPKLYCQMIILVVEQPILLFSSAWQSRLDLSLVWVIIFGFSHRVIMSRLVLSLSLFLSCFFCTSRWFGWAVGVRMFISPSPVIA